MYFSSCHTHSKRGISKVEEVWQNLDPFEISEKLLLILVGTATKTTIQRFYFSTLCISVIHLCAQNVETWTPVQTSEDAYQITSMIIAINDPQRYRQEGNDLMVKARKQCSRFNRVKWGWMFLSEWKIWSLPVLNNYISTIKNK